MTLPDDSTPLLADDPVPGEDTAPAAARLAHVPLTFFAATMGLAGLTLAWRQAASQLGAPVGVADGLLVLTTVAFAASAIAYLLKLARHPAEVRADLHHPIRLAFLPTPGIALVLLAAAGLDRNETLSTVAWWLGAVLQLALTLFVLNAWIARPTFTIAHVTPAWFIPAVGLVTIPLAGAEIAPTAINWFYLANGLILWAAFLPLVLGRLFLHDKPVPPRLLPTMAILVAPPAVVLLALRRLEHITATGPVAFALYGIAVFFVLLLVLQIPRLVRVPFSMAWWGFSFPLAAFSGASVVVLGNASTNLDPVAWTILGTVTLIILGLLVTTLRQIAAGRICVPEPPLPGT